MNEKMSIVDKIPESKSKNSAPHIQKKTDHTQSMNSPVDRILYLQRTIGNQAVQKLIKSRTLQTKLRIGQPGDIYEQEADRVAEQVMRMHGVSRQTEDARIQRKCPKCEEELHRQPEKKEEELQAKETRGEILEVTPQMEEYISTLGDGGQPLPESVRAFMEPRFGHDFSQVRVHTDAKAAESVRALNAQAYTVGQDMMFGAGQYAPETSEGKRLMAHELTHVVQQQGTANSLHTRLSVSNPEDFAETEADRTTGAAMSGVSAVPGSFDASSPMIQRTCGETGIAATVAAGGCTNLFDKTFISGSPPFKFNKNCDEFVLGQDEALQRFAGGLPATTTLEIHGFASMDGPLGFNQNLGCARALKAQSVLTTPNPRIGFAGIKSRITGIINHGPVPGNAADRRSVVIRTTAAPTEKYRCINNVCTRDDVTGTFTESTCGGTCTPPPAFVCGPDIDAQLTKVLGEMQTHFRALGGWEKHWSCQWLITPPMAIMAWDIHQLFLPETDWLRLPPFFPPCGRPPAPAGGDVEDPNTCSNSVRVGGKCNLAGTANYATFGIMMKECYDYYNGSPALWTWKANIPFFTETGMKAFIGLYKTVTFDDRVPPTEFAVATYKGGPTGRPTTENRKHCSTACGASTTPPAFTFVWEPYKVR